MTTDEALEAINHARHCGIATVTLEVAESLEAAVHAYQAGVESATRMIDDALEEVPNDD